MRDTSTTAFFGGLAAGSYGADDERPPLVLLHGLTYDRRQWAPVLRELAVIDPGRRVVALDLPGHGDSPRRDTYRGEEIVTALHRAVTEAGLGAPVIVGHSLGGALATIYAGRYPTRGVVNIDQPLLVGGFGELLRKAEPVLRGPDWESVWNSLLAGMHIELLPPAARELVETATSPRQDLLLGYWQELMSVPERTHREARVRDLRTIGQAGVPYHYVSGGEVPAAYRQWLESVLPAAAVTVLPGGGHFPHLAHPAELARIMAG
ncbi:Pimeloyl-ACP methyl ester carboxylesterase [Streptomyces sp. DvalAA-14]|uniref:alpha/beta fold hydrolase n=1 Tax=unclassified Streptomyces TaxID=2593676 RepID=UPI00081B946C|nr:MULTISPECIES: alpha/beta hydrolase [unclassified Streptomyces]MYS23357.1 alpha/beta fold hydrolase [Streptomyces sp. SID4948]SCE32069.1 Pimeloyl-ACP methyl ester carboxylesterase [Streptomyces sp. DvalAA-14]